MATLVQWAKAQRKLMEMQASELAKDLTDKEIVELQLPSLITNSPVFIKSVIFDVIQRMISLNNARSNTMLTFRQLGRSMTVRSGMRIMASAKRLLILG